MGTLRKDNQLYYRPYADELQEYPIHNITDFEFSPTTLKRLQDIAVDNTLMVDNILMNPGDMWFSTNANIATTTGQVSYFIGSDDPGLLYKKDHSEYTKEKTELDSIIAHYYGRSLLT